MWQTDFPEVETTGCGIWRICAVINRRRSLRSSSLSPKCSGFSSDDLRGDRGVMDVGRRDCDRPGPGTHRAFPDNGPGFRGGTFAELFTGDEPLLRHARTRVRSLQTRGVIERFFGTLKYEHLYCGIIGDGNALGVEVHRYRCIYNTVRQNQMLPNQTPRCALNKRPGDSV